MTAVELIIDKITDEFLALCHKVLEDDTVSTNIKIGENTLRDSKLNADLFATWGQSQSFDPVLTAFFNNYVGYLEWTRLPEYGKKPPIDALKEWAANAGLPTDVGTLWAISTAIWRDGHQGRPIFATIAANLDRLFADDWAPQLRDAITTELDKFFN